MLRLAGRHGAGAVTRARHQAAKAARSAVSRPLAANSSANRRGNRRVVLRVPRRFADDFAASGLDVADLAAFADQWRARLTAPGQ